MGASLPSGPFPVPSPLFPGWPFPAPLPLFPVRRLRVLSAPSPEWGSRPPRAVPGLFPDRLRQSGFSIFHRPFAIPPSWFSGMKKGLDLSCQAPVVGLPPFPAPMKKPPFVVKERFFSRLAVHYFVFLYVSLCTLLQAKQNNYIIPFRDRICGVQVMMIAKKQS